MYGVGLQDRHKMHCKLSGATILILIVYIKSKAQWQNVSIYSKLCLLFAYLRKKKSMLQLLFNFHILYSCEAAIM